VNLPALMLPLQYCTLIGDDTLISTLLVQRVDGGEYTYLWETSVLVDIDEGLPASVCMWETVHGDRAAVSQVRAAELHRGLVDLVSRVTGKPAGETILGATRKAVAS
jgi:hypothetical protein